MIQLLGVFVSLQWENRSAQNCSFYCVSLHFYLVAKFPPKFLSPRFCFWLLKGFSFFVCNSCEFYLFSKFIC